VTVGVALTLVLLALTLAVQPWSVLAGILLVASHRGVLKESLYVLGWMIALSVVFALSIAFSPSPPTSSSSTTAHVIEIVTGALLGLVLFTRWRKPPVTDQVKQPKWLAKLDSMSPVLALALGAFLPNYLVVVAAAGQILQLDLSKAAVIGIGIAFVLVASLGVAAPLGVLVFKHGQADAIYESWRLWLIKNSRAVSYGTGAVVCAVLVVKGTVGLLT
jgi:hypothetical protein